MIRLQAYSARLLALAFDDEDEFKIWAENLNPYDVKYWLKEFEKEELYEFCAILRDISNLDNDIIVHLYNGLP